MRSLINAVALLATIIICVMSVTAYAHDAAPTAAKPQGWSYPFECCAAYDCRAVNNNQTSVKVTEDGNDYVISTTGERIASNDKRVRPSMDDKIHWCSEQGADNTPTLCILIPPNAY